MLGVVGFVTSVNQDLPPDGVASFNDYCPLLRFFHFRASGKADASDDIESFHLALVIANYPYQITPLN